MEFRWVAGITLWTLLIGPIMSVPPGSASRPAPAKAATVKAKAPLPR